MFEDSAVSGADSIKTRPGFTALLDRIEGNGGVRTVIVEDASRFAQAACNPAPRDDIARSMDGRYCDVTVMPDVARVEPGQFHADVCHRGRSRRADEA